MRSDSQEGVKMSCNTIIKHQTCSSCGVIFEVIKKVCQEIDVLEVYCPVCDKVNEVCLEEEFSGVYE